MDGEILLVVACVAILIKKDILTELLPILNGQGMRSVSSYASRFAG